MQQLLEYASKFVLIVLLTQMGKTFICIKTITHNLNEDREKGKSITVVHTMNTHLSNKQFAKRLQEIQRNFGDKSVLLFSSKCPDESWKKNHVKNLNNLIVCCAKAQTCPKVVIMCSNNYRFDDVAKFMNSIDVDLKRHGTTAIIHRAFIYFDELHAYINNKGLRDKIEEMHDLPVVHGISAMCATPDCIFIPEHPFWSNIKLINLGDYNDHDYAGTKDMIYNSIDDFFDDPYSRPHPFDFDKRDEENIGFIKHVLDNNPQILKDCTLSFIPGHIRRIGHNAIRELVLEKNPNAVVVVLNGIEKNMQYRNKEGDTETIPLASSDEELCESLNRIIMNNQLQSRAIVITGFLCVGMGQTLMHKDLGSFTSAIFGHI